jgi:hypothetical protein
MGMSSLWSWAYQVLTMIMVTAFFVVNTQANGRQRDGMKGAFARTKSGFL